MNSIFAWIGIAMQVANALLAAEEMIMAGQPVTLPEVRTYIGNKHIAIDVTVKPIA